jgi:hypothetical protein
MLRPPGRTAVPLPPEACRFRRPRPGEFAPRDIPILHGNPYAPAVNKDGTADCQGGQTGYPDRLVTNPRWPPDTRAGGFTGGGSHVVLDPDTPGLAGGTADPFGFGLCLIGMGIVFAVPLWKRKLITLADLFRQRYSSGVEKIAVFMMLPATLMWAAAQIRAFGQVLTASSSLELEVAIAIAATIVIV